MLSSEEKKVLDTFLNDYLFNEIFYSILSIFVFLILSVGLFYSGATDLVNYPTIYHSIYFVFCAVLSMILILLSVQGVVRLFKYKKVLKSDTFTIKPCVSCNPTLTMDRYKKEVEILCQYKDLEGELCKKSYRTFSKNNNLTVQDCEEKEGYFIKFTDDLSFIMIK